MQSEIDVHRTAFVLFREHGKDAALRDRPWAEAWLDWGRITETSQNYESSKFCSLD